MVRAYKLHERAYSILTKPKVLDPRAIEYCYRVATVTPGGA